MKGPSTNSMTLHNMNMFPVRCKTAATYSNHSNANVNTNADCTRVLRQSQRTHGHPKFGSHVWPGAFLLFHFQRLEHTTENPLRQPREIEIHNHLHLYIRTAAEVNLIRCSFVLPSGSEQFCLDCEKDAAIP